MSWVLGIDTSSTELGVGLVHEQSAVCGFCRYVRNSHAEQLPAIVDFILHGNGIGADDIMRVGVAVGPGSFTGLRIGIAFLKGFFFGRPARMLPISSLESVAVAWPVADRDIVVAFDARQGEVFRARFSRDTNRWQRQGEDVRSSMEELNDTLTGEELVLTDSLGNRRGTVWERISGAGAIRPIEQTPVQRGLACALIASWTPDSDSRWAGPTDVVPRYLQQSRAETRRTHARGPHGQ